MSREITKERASNTKTKKKKPTHEWMITPIEL